MRDYGKVFSTFWTSDSTRGLSDDAKLLALYLLSGPHSNIIGCFRLPDGYVSEDLEWTTQRVAKGFGELFRKGFATREESTKWVFVHKHLKWNPLENPNQVTGALRLYDQIPGTSSVKPLIASALREYTRPGLKGFATLPQPFPNPSPTLSKPGTGSETGTGAASETGEQEGRLRSLPPPPPPETKPPPADVPPPQNSKSPCGESGNVLLTRQEHEKLRSKFGEAETARAIQFLDDDLGSKGKDRYKSHYHALRKWVFDAVKERETRLARAAPRAFPAPRVGFGDYLQGREPDYGPGRIPDGWGKTAAAGG